MLQITEIENTCNEISSKQHNEIANQQYVKLNIKQKEIVDNILSSTNNTDNSFDVSCFYIDGPGGSGKTFIYTTLYHLLKSKSKEVCTMAFTGIAATLLPGGRTVHKAFGMPVPLFHDSTSNIKKQSKECEYLKNIDVFIWDEAPMAPRYALELVDRTLKDIMNNNLLFGGKIIILGGDFRQLLPVQKNATRSELINLSIKSSQLWQHFKKFSLTENMRALSEEQEFVKFLLAVGDGTLNDNNDNIKISEHFIAPKNTDCAYDIFYETISHKQYDRLAKTVILAARNADVNDINKKVVQFLDPSTERI